ncbi:chloride channel protein [candidate division KSB1 bacterium]|nr:chloride channel protein [candidate division KSB1 bacterium]
MVSWPRSIAWTRRLKRSLPKVASSAARLIATTITLASGGSGGVFAPSLFMGAMLGGVVGKLANFVVRADFDPLLKLAILKFSHHFCHSVKSFRQKSEQNQSDDGGKKEGHCQAHRRGANNITFPDHRRSGIVLLTAENDVQKSVNILAYFRARYREWLFPAFVPRIVSQDGHLALAVEKLLNGLKSDKLELYLLPGVRKKCQDFAASIKQVDLDPGIHDHQFMNCMSDSGMVQTIRQERL